LKEEQEEPGFLFDSGREAAKIDDPANHTIMASANTSRVRIITTFNQYESAMSDTNSVVVILYTAPGCPHCNRFLPQYNSISIESAWNNISFYNVNIMSGDGLGIARRNNVGGVPHTSFYSRAKKLGDMRGDSISEFRKLLAKHLQDRTFVGAGYVLGSSANSEPPRAMGNSREENAKKLEKKSVPAHKIEALEGMGFERSKAIAALQRTEGDVDQAADILLGGGSAQDKAWIAGVSIDTEASDAQRRELEQGRKCGIGLGLVDHWDNTGPRVSDVVPYSPSAEAKIFNKGDKIVAIDGVDVRGFRVDQLKNLILGAPGTQVEISFVPVSHLRWGGGLLGGNDSKDIVKVILTREVRLDTCLAGARGKDVKTQTMKKREEPASAKPAWYSTVWQDIKSGSERMSKSSCSLLCGPWLTPPPPYRPGEWLQVSWGQDRGGRQRHRKVSLEWMGENLQRSQRGSEVHQRIDGFCKRDHDGGGRENQGGRRRRHSRSQEDRRTRGGEQTSQRKAQSSCFERFQHAERQVRRLKESFVPIRRGRKVEHTTRRWMPGRRVNGHPQLRS